MTRTRALHFLLTCGVVILPAAAVLFLVIFYVQARLTDFVPHYPLLDDLRYWREAYTFSAVGFNGGYYTTLENPAPAAFTHFHAHGPFYPMLYGTLGRIFGWYLYSAPVFNMAFLTLALGLYVWGTRLDNRRLILTGLVVVTTWPVLFYLTSNVQESFQQSLAVGMAYIFYRLIAQEGDTSLRFKLLAGLYIFLASLTRRTWAFLYLPFFLLILDGSLRARALALAGAAAGFVVINRITDYVYAPYADNPLNYILSDMGAAFRESGILAALQAGASRTIENVGYNLDFWNRGVPLEITQRYQFLLMLAALGVWGVYLYRQRKTRASTERRTQAAELGFHLYNLGLILIFNLLVYTMAGMRDYRVMAPHLLLSGLLLAAFSRYRLAILFIIGNLLFANTFRIYYKSFGQAYFKYDQAKIEQFERDLGGAIVFDPQAANAWCNTLLYNYYVSYQPPITAVPAGIGLSFFGNTRELTLPIKSRYLMLDEAAYQALEDRVRLEKLATTEIGSVYRNLDADCP